MIPFSTIYACKALDIKLVYMYYNGEIEMCNTELRQAVHKNAMRYCIFYHCILVVLVIQISSEIHTYLHKRRIQFKYQLTHGVLVYIKRATKDHATYKWKANCLCFCLFIQQFSILCNVSSHSCSVLHHIPSQVVCHT